jgi:hypothetical protein
MGRPEWVLEAASFTSTSALVREIEAWLEFSNAKLTVVVTRPKQKEEIFNLLEGWKTFGRVLVTSVAPTRIAPRR